MAWKDQQSQPRSDIEKGNIAAEAMGMPTKGKARAPRFHRMSITAAANGVSVNHTMKVKVKRGHTTNSGEQRGSTLPTSGDDMTHHDSEHVFGGDHPVMHHINAIHQHIMTNLKSTGTMPAGAVDDDDED
jgi:hypothetical protein